VLALDQADELPHRLSSKIRLEPATRQTSRTVRVLPSASARARR
jgi:hypothetical protein